MRHLLRLAILLLLCLIVIGLFRGWFTVSNQITDHRTTTDAAGDRVDYSVSVDKGKIKSDVKKAEDEIKEEVKEIEGDAKAKEDK